MSNIFYDPKKINMTINSKVITGYSSGSIVEVAYSEARATVYTGAQGDHTVSLNSNSSGTAKLTLVATSPSLPLIYDLAKRTEPFDFYLCDTNDGTKMTVSSNDCLILEYPVATRNKEVTEVSISIFIPNLNPKT